MKTKKTTSINFTTLKYLVIFSITLLFIVWFFQMFYLSYFYEKYKISNFNTVLKYIEDNPQEYLSNLEAKSYEYGLCIEVVGISGNVVFNPMYKGCLLRPDIETNGIKKLKTSLYNSSDKISKLTLVAPEYDIRSLLYGIRMEDGNYLFLNTTLENIESTSQMLQGQLKYITLSAMAVSIIIAYFLSKQITKPIINITNKAKRIGNGDFSLTFEKSNIRELNDLSDTLNTASIELKQTDDLRRDLMANVSHDLKTPLTMIKAYAEMIKDISHNDSKKRDEHLNIIINESERLNILVNDILELSKMRSKKDNLELEEFDICKEIDNILKNYSIIKETLKYEFITKYPESCIVIADSKKIHQVIYNLINNAINYTGKDNKVYIDVKEDKNSVRISIRDTGKGIKEEHLKNIWNRYYKNDKNHQRNVVGTGLGLAIVKEILEAHGFEYGVNTEKNKGTEFYFIINKKKNK